MASMPEETATPCGQLMVHRASSTEWVASRWRPLTPSLRISFLSVNTAFMVTSLPVPAVVGMATVGTPGFLTW